MPRAGPRRDNGIGRPRKVSAALMRSLNSEPDWREARLKEVRSGEAPKIGGYRWDAFNASLGTGKQLQIDPADSYGPENVNPVEIPIMRKGKS
jgi:hypothetical protein